MKYFIFFIVIIMSISGCNSKKENTDSDFYGLRSEDLARLQNGAASLPVIAQNSGDKRYVIPAKGIPLFKEPDKNGSIIRILPQNTELRATKENVRVVIDNYWDYWYKATVEDETGFVFGKYLNVKSIDTSIPVMGKPKITERSNQKYYPDPVFEFPNGIVLERTPVDIHKCAGLKLYERNSKESGFIIMDDSWYQAYRIPGIEDWLYVINIDNDNQNGYFFIYDIPVVEYGGIKEYGPLVLIYRNGINVEFWKSYPDYSYIFSDFSYYPESDELFFKRSVSVGEAPTEMILYNLEFSETRWSGIYQPYTNYPRTYMVSYSWVMESHGAGGNFFYIQGLYIYKINNGFYDEIRSLQFNNTGDCNYEISRIEWINNSTVQIDYTTIKRVTNDMVFERLEIEREIAEGTLDINSYPDLWKEEKVESGTIVVTIDDTGITMEYQNVKSIAGES